MTDLAEHLGRHPRVEAFESSRFDARHGEAGCRRQQHEVAGLESQWTMAVDRQTAMAFQDRAEARLAEGRVADTPAAGATNAPREHRTRLKQGDDLRERIVHGWTLTNEI